MRNHLRHLAAFVVDVYREMIRDRGMLFAAAISFYGIVSLIPLLILAVGVLGYIIGSYEAALTRILALANQYLPLGAGGLEANLRLVSRQSGLLSGIGSIGLLGAGMQVFVILQQVMRIALGSRQEIGYVKTRGIALLMVMVAGALLFLSIGTTSLIAAIRAYRFWGFDPSHVGALWQFLAILGPLLVSTLAFSLTYRFLPGRDIGTTGSAIGGVTAGLLFEIGKHAFRWYVTHFVDFSRIYGSLGGLAVLVFWIHYISIITVIGAEVTSVYVREEECTPTP